MTKHATLALLTAMLLLATPVAPANDSNHLVTVVTSGSSETRAMALILTRQHVRDGGTAQVLLCDEGGKLALADAEEGPVIEPAGASPSGMLQALTEADVSVDVCAIFLPNRAETEDDLLPGVGVAAPDAITEAMNRPNARILSL
ncbi:MAG: hypothetical protein R6V11_03485 [Ectothiorhodospiraceae bacterium]